MHTERGNRKQVVIPTDYKRGELWGIRLTSAVMPILLAGVLAYCLLRGIPLWFLVGVFVVLGLANGVLLWTERAHWREPKAPRGWDKV